MGPGPPRRLTPTLPVTATAADPVSVRPAMPSPAHRATADLVAGRHGRPLVFGVLNVTPDSFSDGGRWSDIDSAVQHGMSMFADGADVVDVGGESTRPGAGRVDVAEELRRTTEVVRVLAAHGPVSIDTTRVEVAAAALTAGAVVVNDVSGGLADPRIAGLVAEARCTYVAMHWRGHSAQMADRARYDDPAGEVAAELAARLDHFVGAGVDAERIVLDPGIGFAKDEAHNWAVLGGLDRVAALGRPLLVGVSRKRFLGQLLADDTGTPRAPHGRDHASAALAALLAAHGVWAVRAHDPRATADAVRAGAAWAAADRRDR